MIYATSFSRAFEKFHGIKPSLVNKEAKLKNFPRVVFNEDINITTELDYEIITLDKMNLYGVSSDTNNEEIEKDAPTFFRETENKYLDKYDEVKYGMITYDVEREESQKYYCLYDKKIKNLNISEYLKVNGLDLELIHRMLKKFKTYLIGFMASSYHQLNII